MTLAMTYALFEEAGKFQAGRILSESDASLQAELDSGKRVKVKAAQVLLRFASPTPAVLLPEAQALADTIDLNLAWEFSPEAEFGFADLARDYFDAKATLAQQTAALLALHQAPHYFRRLGKGNYRKASEDTVKAALAGIEKKRLMALQIEAWAKALAEGQCPEPIQQQIYKILFKPDKNSAEYRAVVEASKRSQRPPLELLRHAGAIDNAYQFHWRRFLFDHFPNGVAHAALQAPDITEALPTATVSAFSIDDSSTTEIDDALSVQGQGTGVVTVGVHIAAPGLAIAPGSPLDKLAQDRMSTVYIPGWKMTMLPDAVVQRYTLQAGHAVPAVSLYVRVDETTLAVIDSRTELERVPIAENLRHDQLDEVVTVAALEAPANATFGYAAELAFLFRLAKHLKLAREHVRGKPENFNRPDPVYTLSGRDRNDEAPPDGTERIELGARRRGAPLDLIVAEAMILANNTWGGWLASLHVPGIYRTQASMAPGMKVRMGTKPLPHAGMGVAHYTWATSPLRRYVDLVNQWQIIAAARHGKTAALAAPFKARDASLMAIVSSFDAAYSAYADVQRQLERYWVLRWLQQEGVRELEAAVVNQGLARAENPPLVFRLMGADALPRGTRVRAKLTLIDELTLDVHGSLVARLDAPTLASDDDKAPDEDDDEAALAAQAAPLALAIDLDESDAPTADPPPQREPAP